MAASGLLILGVVAAAAGQEPRARATPGSTTAVASGSSVRIVLVGDSTVTDDSGWGLGFKRLLAPGVDCRNAAANGRSSKSFRDEGRWAAALDLKGDYYLLQFGHNDEPGKGPERETDPATTYAGNMSRYVDEVRAIGGRPILVTSLVRRIFGSDTGKIVSTQTAYVDAVRRVAAEKGVPLIDLFARSLELSERLGPDALASISARQPNGSVDTTHVNADGSLLFGRVVARELRHAAPEIAPLLRDEPDSRAVPIEHPPDAIVAADGSAPFHTIQEAVNAVPQSTTAERRWVILVRPGRYRELVYVQREKRFVSLVGEDPVTTVVTYDLHANMTGLDGRPIGTFRTPTAVIDADDFAAENLTFENAAGPVAQALAIRVDGDRAVFRNCRFLGWQDTIFLNRGRQYFEDSFIAGHVDFIFGGATAFFERCHVHAWRDGYITAAATPPEARFGFVFSHATITGQTPDVRVYLGRPWRDFAAVAFVDTAMSNVVRPEGWHNWDRPEREQTVRYGERGSSGTGATPDRRVRWAASLSADEASHLTSVEVLGGQDRWDPRTVQAHPVAVRATGGTLPAAPGSGRP